MTDQLAKHKYIATPSDFTKLWNEYKAHIDAHPDIIEEVSARGIFEKKVKKPYTRQGFESYVYAHYGYHVKQYIENTGGAYGDYLGVVTHARNEWENDQITGTITGKYKAPNLVARLCGLADQSNSKVEISEIKITHDR